MPISITKPTVGGSEDTWGGTINTALDAIVDGINNNADGTTAIAPDLSALTINGTDVTGADGVTAVTAAELSNAVAGFVLEDGDGTELTITGQKQVKFVEGNGININWTDTSTGSAADPYDMEFKLKVDRRDGTDTNVWTGNAQDFILFDASVGMRFYTAAAEDMRLLDNGTLHVDGDIIAYSTTISDERLKTNIQPIEAALDKVCQLNGYTFDYIRDNRASAGVIAQEVEAVLPSAITEQEGGFHGEDGQPYKAVQYDQLHGLLIEAIKELKAEIEALKNGG